MFSYPLISLGNYEYEVVESLELNEFGQQKVQATREELEMEREAVSDIMGWNYPETDPDLRVGEP